MISINELPVELQKLLAGGSWQEITVGRSDNLVFRIVRPHGPACYLKIAAYPFEQELLAEKERLAWLQRLLPVPEIYAFCADSGHTYLLLSEIAGLMACDDVFEQDIPALVLMLAEGLRLIHQVEIARCPFDERLAHKIALARQRVEAGLVDELDFDEKRKGIQAEALFKVLIESRPSVEDLVFTHGDYCLPNVLIDQPHGQINGFIDWGRAGVADRYHDLALAARSLIYNFGPGWEPLLWEAYGLEAVDNARLEFYQLLDEFF